MEMKFTPGPWEEHDGDFVCVEGDASKMICDIRGWGWLQKLGEEKAIRTQIANAKLIACSPELLDSVRTSTEVIKALLSGKSIKNLDEAIAYNEALIKKATS